MTRWTSPNLIRPRPARGATASSPARGARDSGAAGSAPRDRSPRATPPVVVTTATRSPRLRCATARDATSRMLRSNADEPLVAGRRRPLRVEGEHDVRARLAGPLAHDHLPDCGGLAPVDVARVFAGSHQLQAEELLAVTAPDDAVGAGRPARGGGRELHRVDRGIDDELSVGRDLARLFEETERKAGRDAEADVSVAPAVGGRAPIGRDLRRLRD